MNALEVLKRIGAITAHVAALAIEHPELVGEILAIVHTVAEASTTTPAAPLAAAIAGPS